MRLLFAVAVVVLLSACLGPKVIVADAEPIPCTGEIIAVGTTAAQVQSKVNASKDGTVFCWAPGAYVLTSLITLKNGTQMICTARRACLLTGMDTYRGGFASAYGSSGQVIRGFVLERFKHLENTWPISPLQVRAGGLMEDNESRYNYQGADLDSDNTLRGNYLHHNARYGLSGGPGKNIVIEGNDISFNNTGKFDFGDAGGSKLVGTQDPAGLVGVIWRGNYVHDNYGVGIWSDGNVKDVVYESNRVENNALTGIFHEISWKAVIRNNVVRNNNTLQGGTAASCWHQADIVLNNSQDVEITNNIVESASNRNPICMVSATRPGDAMAAFPQSTKNVTVTGNHFGSRGTSQHGYTGNSAAVNVQFSGNTYYTDDLSRANWAYDAYPINKSQWQGKGQDTTGSFYKW